jgi:hypothetical protein
MRFEVGQIVPVVNVSFHARYNVDQFQAAWMRHYHPAYHLLDGIEVKLLEVTEHHKVASEFDDTPDCDGFVLRETVTGDIWHNQYPVAVYGQLDDSRDRMVQRKHDHFTKEEADAMSDDEHDAVLRYWPTGLAELQSVYRALNGPERDRLEFDEEDREMFELYHERLKAIVEEAAGKHVEYRELEMGVPKRRLENCWRAHFVDENATKTAP